MTKDKLNSLIGQRIVALREKKADKSPQAIEKIENGKVNSTIYSLYEISKALGVSVSSLLEI